jgi:hypothetical protein
MPNRRNGSTLLALTLGDSAGHRMNAVRRVLTLCMWKSKIKKVRSNHQDTESTKMKK